VNRGGERGVMTKRDVGGWAYEGWMAVWSEVVMVWILVYRGRVVSQFL